MEDLIVVTYKNEYAAEETMQTLRNLEDGWMVDIHDAVAVARDADGKLHIQDSYKATTQAGAGWGVLLGTILGGLALVPLTGGLSAAAAAGTVAAGAAFGGIGGAAIASWNKQADGVSDDFVSTVSDTIRRGQSAIFALVESHDPDQVLEYFRGTGGTVIRTNLSLYEQERIQQILSRNY
jgi:uncharacterized membrane protein